MGAATLRAAAPVGHHERPAQKVRQALPAALALSGIKEDRRRYNSLYMMVFKRGLTF